MAGARMRPGGSGPVTEDTRVHTLASTRRAVGTLVVLAAALLVPCLVAPAHAEDSITWKNGLRYSSADGSTNIKFGGRLHLDFAWIDADQQFLDDVNGGQEFDDGAEFRRARLFFSGTLYHDFEFKAQYEFGGFFNGFRDAYVGVRNVPGLGTVRVGQQFEPMGLEVLTSSNYITFMERGVNSVFNRDRNVGLRILNHWNDGAINASVGAFRQTDEYGKAEAGSAYDLAGRVTGSPVYLEDGRKVVHVGIGGTWSFAADDSLRFRARPEVHWLPRLISTPVVPADASRTVNAEAAVVLGPISFQGEFTWSGLDSEPLDNPSFTAWYAYASFFVTGEHREYDREEGIFGRVKPKRTFRTTGEARGAGALELAVRFSSIDLEDGMVTAGTMDTWTVGANWYLNPASRVMLNFVHSDPSTTSSVSALQTRFQVDF